MLPTIAPTLLDLALTHRSMIQISGQSNERLEFLGDAVLELLVSEFLYDAYPEEDEGALTRYRAALVRTETLGQLGRELELDSKIHVRDEQETTLSDSVIADTFEAFIGALYLDQGLPSCKQFLQTHLFPKLEVIVGDDDGKDAKTLLQEKVQALGQTAPAYRTVNEEGPDHAKIFTVEVSVPEHKPQIGTGTSKQRAEQDAASKLLAML